MTQPTRLYVHGLPGGEADLDIAGWPDATRPRVVAPLTAELPGTGAVRLYAFSGGAQTALRLAADHPERVERVVLIAPVAPLELGALRDGSLSAELLEAARHDPGKVREAFAALGQADPDTLLDTLFDGVDETELALVNRPDLRPFFRRTFADGLGPRRDVTQAAFLALGQRWSDRLDRVTSPVEIHVGDADRRCPPVMGRVLCESIGENATLELHEGLGHYGMLRAVAERQTV